MAVLRQPASQRREGHIRRCSSSRASTQGSQGRNLKQLAVAGNIASYWGGHLTTKVQQEPWRTLLADSLTSLNPSGFLTQLRTTCPGTGAAHSGLDLPLSINNQDSSPQRGTQANLASLSSYVQLIVQADQDKYIVQINKTCPSSYAHYISLAPSGEGLPWCV